MIVPLLAGLLGSVPLELDAYLRAPNPAKSWTVASKTKAATEIKLTSQEWQGKKWQHDLLIVQPSRPLGGKIAILYVTGDRVDRADLPFIQRLADRARMPVVALFNVPNQPIWDQREDELIAYTFGQYLQTGDASWPLLFPMTKSAISAMDAAESIGGYHRFVVCGASKRGWTTWMAGVSGDKRIVGIAPMVYDNLNLKAQLEHQLKYYGKYSEMIGDYTAKGLTEVMATEPGKKLAAMVDPYSYLPRLKVPVLAVVGANDRYWTVDSHTIYWDQIPTQKFLSIVPNAGHNLGDGEQATDAIAFFARACLGTLPGGLPHITSWSSGDCGDKRSVRHETWLTFTLGNLDFRDSKWTTIGVGGSTGAPPSFASFQAVTLKSDGLSAKFCSPVRVAPAHR